MDDVAEQVFVLVVCLRAPECAVRVVTLCCESNGDVVFALWQALDRQFLFIVHDVEAGLTHVSVLGCVVDRLYDQAVLAKIKKVQKVF